MAQETNQNNKNINKISESVEDPQDTAQVEGEQNQNTTNDVREEAMKALQLDAANRVGDEEHSLFTRDMVLIIEIQESGKTISNRVDRELIVGRADNITSYIPEVDMTEHGAYRLGLSRRHAVIQRNGNSLVVKDLNSRNGTFVNGAIVPGGSTHPIQDGDELRFGNLVTHVIFEKMD